MSRKNFFDNNFDNDVGHMLLNDTSTRISKTFQNKLNDYMEKKLHMLTTKMQSEMFNNGTVYTGSAGLALFYLRRHLKNPRTDDNYLKLALQYIDLRNLKGRRISFLCGDAGPLAIATVISYRMGNNRPKSLPDYNTLAQRLLDLISLLKESPDELLYGGAGYLYALLFVKEYVHEPDIIPSKQIEKVIANILRSGRSFSAQMKSESPLLWQWHDKIYLGAAHGVAGILYLLLQGRSYVNHQDMRSLVKPTLDWLARQKYASGNFPSSLGSSSGDRLVQWCHGAPGFVPLFVLAYQIFEDDGYFKIALQCGDIIWQRGLCAKGYSLCHGVSGNAYSFFYLYQATKDPIHLYRACCFMEWCAVEMPDTEQHPPDRPASLFEGLLGRLCLAEDISSPEDAMFPAFTL
ncbi:LanC-like protein 2 [Papilio xuthus]|uniref:LanC-like protein 2 n=1 Tax=Papilio xuthus TaxID=66420 RepID=A0A194PEK4_PAPXU|nr:LanC-like protein 2 [Papilio xuthus]